MDYFNYHRRKSSEVLVGKTPMGGCNPVRIQSMANVSTMETDAAVQQAIRMINAGAEYVRFTTQGEREAHNIGNIRRELNKKGYTTPLVADVHFNPKAADAAATEVEKVRINPGNYVDRIKTFSHIEYTDDEYAIELQKIRDRFIPFLNICRKHHTAIRIGVNHGSLSDRIMSRYGDTPHGMVESCMEFLRICIDENFRDVVISIKASNPMIMVKTVRLLIRTMEQEGMDFPLHLGVTEAGDGEDGRIKSAVGIGALLADGIGDTIRVSLSEEPEAEIPVAKSLVNYISERENAPEIKACTAPQYDPISVDKRATRSVGDIGQDHVPVVISDYSDDNSPDFMPDFMPDFVYVGHKDIEGIPGNLKLIVDADVWNGETYSYPCFTAAEAKNLTDTTAAIKFIRLSYQDLNDEILELLRDEENTVVMLVTDHQNGFGEQRAAFHKLWAASVKTPVIICRNYNDENKESLQLKSATDIGALFIDGFGEGIMISDKFIRHGVLDETSFGILQAVKRRISKTEYISCPSCGRTLYNLQTTIARIKAATSHLKGLKIGIMGCIVNGPGEMADADYGYVGAGRNQISLYKGKDCILRNIPEDEAVDKLVHLIKENGDWKD